MGFGGQFPSPNPLLLGQSWELPSTHFAVLHQWRAELVGGRGNSLIWVDARGQTHWLGFPHSCLSILNFIICPPQIYCVKCFPGDAAQSVPPLPPPPRLFSCERNLVRSPQKRTFLRKKISCPRKWLNPWHILGKHVYKPQRHHCPTSRLTCSKCVFKKILLSS